MAQPEIERTFSEIYATCGRSDFGACNQIDPCQGGAAPVVCNLLPPVLGDKCCTVGFLAQRPVL